MCVYGGQRERTTTGGKSIALLVLLGLLVAGVPTGVYAENQPGTFIESGGLSAEEFNALTNQLLDIMASQLDFRRMLRQAFRDELTKVFDGSGRKVTEELRAIISELVASVEDIRAGFQRGEISSQEYSLWLELHQLMAEQIQMLSYDWYNDYHAAMTAAMTSDPGKLQAFWWIYVAAGRDLNAAAKSLHSAIQAYRLALDTDSDNSPLWEHIGDLYLTVSTLQIRTATQAP